ncbi:hypothetical protein CRENBAI_015581 [Crenichthys baileyi]|uniref:C-type lectin domain-containing protein n=1 Tax=Crenichthys baileyi TaxID=28760 RepID=A0AAV9R6X6_9TELE
MSQIKFNTKAAEMAEEEISYASLVIKSRKHPQSEVRSFRNISEGQSKNSENDVMLASNKKTLHQFKNENEAVYNEVKVDKEPAQGLLSDKAAERCRRYQLLASCFGTLCLILVLSIIGVCVYLHESAAKELNQVKSQQKVLLEENHNLTNLNNKLSSDYQNLTVQFNNLTAENHNLTNFNNKLSSDYQNLTVQFNNLTAENHNLTNLNNKLSSDYQNLTVQFNNLTAVSKALKNKTTTLTAENHNLTNLNNKLSSDYQNLTVQFNNLTAENHNLTSLNEGLRKERENLTELIKNMEKTWNELNVSRAQWSIDAYCPKKAGGRSCTSCQDGWLHRSPSCYAYNNAAPSNRRNWEDARENCRTKNSDLPVVSDQTEKDYVKTISPVEGDIQGYWIGLRAVEGRWKWIDGSDLINQ